MHDIKTRHYYVKINDSFVHLVQYGTGEPILQTEPYSPKDGHEKYHGKRIVIFLPGNPGPLGVYHDYLELLYKSLGEQSARSVDKATVLLAISHNNFDKPRPSGDSVIELDENHLNFIDRRAVKSYGPNDVELQVLNKLIIIKQLLRYNLEDCQLVFVGHSIGCYIILRLLQDNLVASAHHGSIMIHPALENLALTEKGSKFAKYFNLKLDYVLRSLAFLAETLLSEDLRMSLVKKYLCSSEMASNSSDSVIRSFAQLCTLGSLTATIEMAKSEFERVRDIDHQLLIRPHVDRLRLIYAKDDHWVNKQNRADLLIAYPGLHIEEHPRMHAYIMEPETVMEYSHKVAQYVMELFD